MVENPPTPVTRSIVSESTVNQRWIAAAVFVLNSTAIVCRVTRKQTINHHRIAGMVAKRTCNPIR